MRTAYDYVIVGAGSAGCVLASRLSENPRNEILLIEAGPDDNHPLIAMPVGVGKILGAAARGTGRKSYASLYSISPGANRKPDYWLKGRTLGGSSSVNGMVYMRGVPSDYDRWEELGCTGWGWNTIGRCYREIEHHQLGADAWRGGEGPLHISMSRLDALGRATIAAVVEAGTPRVTDINNIDMEADGGVGPQPCTIWRGRRVSAASAFLRPVRHRANLHVATETEVLGLAFEGSRVTGVKLRGKDAVRTVNARCEIILSAGGIHSPKLLQLSGIGPANILQRHGIAVRVDSSEVGRNLQDHRTVKVVFRLKRGGRNSKLRGLGLAFSALSYGLARRGALTSCIWEVGGMVKTTSDVARPDCQIGVSLFTHDSNGVPKTPAMAIFGYVVRPESRGETMIASPDPAAAPMINANFLTHPWDQQHTISLFRYMRRVAQQPALAPFIAAEVEPGPAAASDEDLVEASFKQGGCGMHVSGTCRMGSDTASVLDPDLRVRGVSGLRVVDTSIMPTLVSGNTNAPAMALAWHAAERIVRGS